MTNKNKKVVIMDVETLASFFSYACIDRDSDTIETFIIWKEKNQLPELLDHLSNLNGQIGFNNLAFDANIIEFILNKQKSLLKLNGDQIARKIYSEAQRIIELEWSEVRNPKIPQLDLFKIHHFDNRAKMCSLKKIEIALGFENVQDMPIHHTQEIENDEQVKIILDYNINDIKATKVFYEKTIDKIELRKGLKAKYNLDCLNYSDSKIGSELLLKLYCEDTNENINIVRKQKTTRNNFKFNECIFDYIKFQTNEFNELLNYLRGIEVKELKESFEHQLCYKGINYFYGTGGIHASCKEGIYESDEDYIIVDADISSMYPSLAIANQFSPAHLGQAFCKVYENDIVKPRLEAKKNGDKVLADGFKLAANSCFGNYNNKYSWLYDARCTLLTTLNGQLSLSMLIEMLHIAIEDISLLQANTDGLTVKIKREDKRKYWEVCKSWEAITKLQLEYITYDKMILRDVNNYLSISSDGKIKRKGIFVLHDEMRKNGDWHKGFNLGILPITLSEYFLNNKSVDEVIRDHKNIYNFCKTFSVKGNFTGETYQLDENGNEFNHKQTQKTVRYYPSNNGIRFRKRGEPLAPKWDKRLEYLTPEDENRFKELIKIADEIINTSISMGEINESKQARLMIECNPSDYKLFNLYLKYLSYIFKVSKVEYSRGTDLIIDCRKDWRLIDIESETNVTIFNTFEDKSFDEYDINYEFVTNEINKVIDLITGEKERREREERELKEKEKIDKIEFRENEIKEKQETRRLEKEKKERNRYIENCINKMCTERVYNQFRKEWMDGIFPPITEFKKSINRKTKEESSKIEENI